MLPLLPFQNDWLNDWSPWKISNKPRQVGYTHVETLSLVERLSIIPRTPWYYLSSNEERAKDAIALAYKHCEALGVFADINEGFSVFEDAKYRHLKIQFPNGSYIIGLPANPRTARGVSGNATLDEFAHHQDADAIWSAVSPATSRGYHLHVISTPNGAQGKFYKLWTGNETVDWQDVNSGASVGDKWSRHGLTIYEAVEQGHPVDVQTVRDLAGDEETFNQEYCRDFLDESTAWLPYKLIESAHSEEASTYPEAGESKLYGGFDIGRKRDLSVLSLLEKRGNYLLTRGVITLKQSNYDRQERLLADWMPRLAKLCIDETGIGSQLSERMVHRYPGKAEGVTFTPPSKAQMAAKLKQKFEKREIGIPDDEALRRDLHSLRREYTLAGNVRYDAPRTKDGHADRFWSMALAVNAAELVVADWANAKTYSPYRQTRSSRDWGAF